jgi:hypothetical protein
VLALVVQLRRCGAGGDSRVERQSNDFLTHIVGDIFLGERASQMVERDSCPRFPAASSRSSAFLLHGASQKLALRIRSIRDIGRVVRKREEGLIVSSGLELGSRG